MTSRAVALRLLGSTAVVTTDDARVAAEVRRLWAPFVLEPAAVTGPTVISCTVQADGGRWRVDGPDRPAVHLPTPAAALLELGTVLNHGALAAVDALAVHAGVVEVDGGCAAFVARSGTGKSTVVAALVRAGAVYVSDEALVVDRATGALLAYPRPLGLSPWSCAAVGLPAPPADAPEVLVAGDELGRVRTGPPGPLRLVVDLAPPDGGPVRVAEQSRQTGAALLLQHAFNHWHAPAGSFAAAHRLAGAARAVRVVPGTPTETALVLLGQLADQPTTPTQSR